MAYNGWTNKETWLVGVWLGDQMIMDQEEGNEISEDYIKDLVTLHLPNTQEFFSKHMDLGFFNDLLNCSLGEINYLEIAKHYKEEM